MFKNLQQKWNVSPRRLWVILAAFGLGGSLCGFLGRKLLAFTGIEKGALYIVCYIIVVTLLWPFCVVLISSLLGEYAFFKNYLANVFMRLMGKSNDKKFNIAVFASGAGSNAKQIINYFTEHSRNKITVGLLVSNRASAGAIAIAQKYNVPHKVINEQNLEDPTSLIQTLHSNKITHIVLAGFLRKIPIDLLTAYPDKIINIHPALLPKYGGHGMYGQYVHEAVKKNKEKETGISIHLVNEVYDEGKIIFQKTCVVDANDTTEEIAQKVLLLEHTHFAPVIKDWILSK
jgi:formyltetrahydrofolate-dependent phosphoribosylglycinamide formyltransferase